MTNAQGEHFSLSYAGQSCPRPGYIELPETLYQPLEAWTFNGQSAGILSALDKYRVESRLATRDTVSAHGFSPHAGFWSEYHWTNEVAQAYLTAMDVEGHDSLIVGLLERPLMAYRFGDQGTNWVEIRRRSLSSRDRSRLLQLLATAEDSLSTSPKMTRRGKTLEQAINAVPTYADARRTTFTEFTLDTLPWGPRKG